MEDNDGNSNKKTKTKQIQHELYFLWKLHFFFEYSNWKKTNRIFEPSIEYLNMQLFGTVLHVPPFSRP